MSERVNQKEPWRYRAGRRDPSLVWETAERRRKGDNLTLRRHHPSPPVALSPAASPLNAAIAYCQGTPWRNEIEARDAARLEDATRHAAAALERRFGSGPIEGRIRALVITATA